MRTRNLHHPITKEFHWVCQLLVTVRFSVCFFFLCRNIPWFLSSSYSGIPILRTSKVDKNWFEKTVRETKIGSKNRRVREIGDKTTVFEEEKRLLVRVIGRFEKLRVRKIGIPLYLFIYLRNIYMLVCLWVVLQNSTVTIIYVHTSHAVTSWRTRYCL